MSGHRANLDVVVRPPDATDFAAIAALTNVFIRETTVHFGAEEVTAAELEAQWERARRRHTWLIAEVGGAFAGYAKAGIWRERSAYRWTAETGVYVADGFRRAGIGRALYARLLDALRAAGFHSVVAGITLPNDPSVALHEALGFRPVGVVTDAGFKFDRWHDVGFWQLILG